MSRQLVHSEDTMVFDVVQARRRLMLQVCQLVSMGRIEAVAQGRADGGEGGEVRHEGELGGSLRGDSSRRNEGLTLPLLGLRARHAGVSHFWPSPTPKNKMI
eukprot:638728-Hanusia_phi.AAC.1